jgi:hypothetical protein
MTMHTCLIILHALLQLRCCRMTGQFKDEAIKGPTVGSRLEYSCGRGIVLEWLGGGHTARFELHHGNGRPPGCWATRDFQRALQGPSLLRARDTGDRRSPGRSALGDT